MPVPKECPRCDAEKGEEYESLAQHLRYQCDGTPDPDEELVTDA